MIVGGEHAHLYGRFVHCPKCRFFALDAAVVAAHVAACTGAKPQAWCIGCRFDAQDLSEVAAHHARGDCPNELGAIIAPIWTCEYP
jgi:hypothetical protein